MDPPSQRVRIHFIDSSDDGASQVAAMNFGSPRDDDAGSGVSSTRVGATSEGSHQPYASGSEGESKHDGRRRSGRVWLSRFVYRGVKAAARLILSQGGDASQAPYEHPADLSTSSQLVTPGIDVGARGDRHVLASSSTSTSSGGSWEFGNPRHAGSSASAPSSESVSIRGGVRGPGDGANEYDEVNLDLNETVLLYLQTGSDVFMNIILATLKASDEPVGGETIDIVKGSPALLKVFLDSGRVNVEDPYVQALVQAKLDEILDGDPYNGDVVPGDALDYVRSLCSVRTSRINFQQMVLLRYSGFDYIELLTDYPYLVENVKKPSLGMKVVVNTLHCISIAISWLGVLVTVGFTAMVLWTVVFWFRLPSHRNNGYWVIITYVGSYVVSLVVTMWAEEGKIRRYANQRWPYPDNNFRFVPIVPLYEILLSYVSLRYEMCDDTMHYFIMRYDLRNGTLVQHIANGLFYALPQVIVQTFLFFGDNDSQRIQGSFLCFWLLLGFASGLVLMSFFAFGRIVAFSHSCDARGFAVLSNQDFSPNSSVRRVLDHRVRSAELAIKILLFFTMYFFIAKALTLFVSLLNLQSCGGGPIAFLAVYVAVIALSIIASCVVYLYLPISLKISLISMPAILMEIAFFLYLRFESENATCVLFASGYSGWIIPSIAFFGLMCVTLIAWAALLLFEFCRGTPITRRAIDHFLLA